MKISNLIKIKIQNKMDCKLIILFILYIFISFFRRPKSLCRICYCSEEDLQSPLISPCLCSGSMKYIHFQCLQTWIKSKISVKISSYENHMNFLFKLFSCELCKTPLPGK